MLEDAHELKRQGVDAVIGFIEPHGRADTLARIGDLEFVPLRQVAYRGVTLQEMDVDAIKKRRPQVVLVDELAHTNAPGSAHQKRYEDVLDLLAAGIDVISAVNIQHIESLNDAITSTTGVRVRETIPDWVLRRANEVVNVDVSVDTLRDRLRQGKIYDPAKIEQALGNFFRKGNLTALRELALRQLASDQAGKSEAYRDREGLDPAVIPDKVMVAIASHGSARTLLRVGSRIAGRLSSDWYAVYVETPKEGAGRIKPQDHVALSDNILFAKQLGARVVRLTGTSVSDALVEFAKREGITHVVFGQSARSRWNLLLHGSIVDRFLREVRNATVQIVPTSPGAGAGPEEPGDG
jgi:two-component system, OmpR family, sensor histidine kinase KdpD